MKFLSTRETEMLVVKSKIKFRDILNKIRNKEVPENKESHQWKYKFSPLNQKSPPVKKNQNGARQIKIRVKKSKKWWWNCETVCSIFVV